LHQLHQGASKRTKTKRPVFFAAASAFVSFASASTGAQKWGFSASSSGAAASLPRREVAVEHGHGRAFVADLPVLAARRGVVAGQRHALELVEQRAGQHLVLLQRREQVLAGSWQHHEHALVVHQRARGGAFDGGGGAPGRRRFVLGGRRRGERRRGDGGQGPWMRRSVHVGSSAPHSTAATAARQNVSSRLIDRMWLSRSSGRRSIHCCR
jgi:hypothetical protein